MPKSLFVIDLNYIVPLEKLDKFMEAHVEFLDQHYKNKDFITSGRKVPRTGGIILATAESKDQVDQWMQKDPFFSNKLAEYKITEFLTSQKHPDFKNFLKDF